jgi:nitrogenase molybdenum-iron protein alpha/beta subunit
MLSIVRKSGHTDRSMLNILAGPHLTPADISELRDIIEAFGLRAVVIPDLSALDGGRQGISPLAEGGAAASDIMTMGQAVFTFAVGACMEGPARILKDRFGIEYSVLESMAGLRDTDSFMKMLSIISGSELPEKYQRQRRILVDTLRDAHFFTAGKSVCIALDESHAIQTSRWVAETGTSIGLAVVSHKTASSCAIAAEMVVTGGLSEIGSGFSLIMANSHAKETADKLGTAHYEIGFPVFRTLGYPQRVTIGYKGATAMIHDMANLLAKEVHR